MAPTRARASQDLAALIRSSTAELDSWLSQEIQDELGTRAYVLRAIAWCRRGALARARADVDAALAKRPTHELVELTGALILYVTRDYDRAVVLLDQVAHAHRYLAAPSLHELAARLARLGWTQEQRERQRELAALGVRDLRGHIADLQQARAQSGLAVVVTTPEQAWASLYESGPGGVEAQLEQLAARTPASAAALAGVRGRLSLLQGRLDEAAAALAGVDASDPGVADEHLALALARGQYDLVAAASLDHSRSSRAWRLRAEASLELGQFDRAREALARADEPDHAITALISTLIDAGDGARSPDAARLHALAPGLLSDAARELGVAIWIDGGIVDDPAVLLRVCTRARSLLSADRSSAPISYRSASGAGTTQLRHVPAAAIARVAHADDERDLDRVARLLLRSSQTNRRRSAHTATAARSLDAEQIEQFMADGYVHLRGAFPRALAESIVDSAHRRLAQDPARWLSGPHVQRQAAELAGYDRNEPRTWPQGRVDVVGEHPLTINEFSPFAERAVFQLLGDAGRIRTRSWTSNLIIQYPRRGEWDPSARAWVPTANQESWHLDSPSVHTRLDQLRTGLLVFIVFSDLLPASGNSWLALDSPARVARALAAAPEGVDFCDVHAGRRITRECERLFEVTGEAGDLLLVHPLMLHSASPNPSPRIRFLGNPMVYMQTPLDHRRADPSPVEQVIARALADR
ncbi:phytanoyl-CoA dioxygenase family protein [Enhygromyxa salina]|uniref:Phytanoyl-CoA dioxygenase (PhyH) n=1 Tax=Enhygromyxa salina TaxID=215803 RepID=A0A2S9YY86_9BACT|nr:phytanoyl-CoA dioxygenase family protein [Enhygromyxa salina]PRQ10051.1 Phytanoyl-CoA dioxygenase (PhyH) [Enhygromyxa salina]